MTGRNRRISLCASVLCAGLCGIGGCAAPVDHAESNLDRVLAIGHEINEAMPEDDTEWAMFWFPSSFDLTDEQIAANNALLDRFAPQFDQLVAIGSEPDPIGSRHLDWSDNEANNRAVAGVGALGLDARRSVETWDCDKASAELAAAIRLAGALVRDGANMFAVLKPVLDDVETLEELPEPLWRANTPKLLTALDTLNTDDPAGMRRALEANAAGMSKRYSRDWLFDFWESSEQSDHEYADAWAAHEAGADLSERQRRMVAYLSNAAMDRRLKEFEVAIALILEHWHQPPSEVADALERRGWRRGFAECPPWTDELVLTEKARQSLNEASSPGYPELSDATSSWAVTLLPDPLAATVGYAQFQQQFAFELSQLLAKERHRLEEAETRLNGEESDDEK